MWFFWCILGPWATANYCRAGIKSLRGTALKTLSSGQKNPKNPKKPKSPKKTKKPKKAQKNTGFFLKPRFFPTLLSKIQNGRHQQRNNQHILPLQTNVQKNPLEDLTRRFQDSYIIYYHAHLLNIQLYHAHLLNCHSATQAFLAPLYWPTFSS